MGDPEEPQADPGYFICYHCDKRIEVTPGQLPPDAWVKGVHSPHYRYVCHDCRIQPTNPRPNPDHYRCLGCATNIAIPEVERRAWQYDPGARIRYLDNAPPKYVGFCPSCFAERVAAAEAVERGRLTRERNARIPALQMERIRQLQVAYEAELDTEGRHRYDRRAAIERAVWLQMLVSEAALYPEFARWLVDHPTDPLAESGDLAA